MAQVTIEIPVGQVDRVRAAWEVMFTRLEGESDADFFKRGVAQLVKNTVLAYERQVAGESIVVDDVAS